MALGLNLYKLYWTLTRVSSEKNVLFFEDKGEVIEGSGRIRGAGRTARLWLGWIVAPSVLMLVIRKHIVFEEKKSK